MFSYDVFLGTLYNSKTFFKIQSANGEKNKQQRQQKPMHFKREITEVKNENSHSNGNQVFFQFKLKIKLEDSFHVEIVSNFEIANT